MNLSQEFKQEIIKTFPIKRIVSLLYFGTRAFVGANNESDYDLMLVLDKYKTSDIFKLRKIAKETKFKGYDLNINLLYYSDILGRRKENFQIRSVQSDLYNYLKQAITLIGKNIFAINPYKIQGKKLTNIMDFKIQEYYGRCDKLYLQNNANKDLYQHLKKYIKDIIRFILIRQEIIKVEDIISYSYKDLFGLSNEYSVFQRKLVSNFALLLKDYEDTNSIKKIEVLRRKIYDKYLVLYSQNSKN